MLTVQVLFEGCGAQERRRERRVKVVFGGAVRGTVSSCGKAVETRWE